VVDDGQRMAVAVIAEEELTLVPGLYLRTRRQAAVRWPGASAPRASQVQVSVWPHVEAAVG